MFFDHAGRPYWLDPRTGQRVYCGMPTPQGCINPLPPSPAMAPAGPNHGCLPYTASPYVYGGAPQQLPVGLQLRPVAPPPTPMVMIPAPAPEKEKKSSGKYYVWEEFYDEKGRPIWTHFDTEKRTRKDLYV